MSYMSTELMEETRESSYLGYAIRESQVVLEDETLLPEYSYLA